MERNSFFRWEESSTNKFLSDELEVLRDAHVDQIIDMINNPEKHVNPEWVIMELVQHANYQKAALVLQELTRMSQAYFNRVWEKCGTELVHELRTADIMRLPRDAEQARKYFGFT